MITYSCNGSDIDLASFGTGVTKFVIYIGQWLHIVAINDDGTITYQGNKSVNSEDVPLFSHVPNSNRLLAHDNPYVTEDLGGSPVVAIIGNDPRNFQYGDTKISSPYITMKRKPYRTWFPLHMLDTSIPNIISSKIIPVVFENNDVYNVSQDDTSIVVRLISKYNVNELTRLNGFTLVDAISYGDDIVVAAIWNGCGYPRQSLSIDEFNGGNFSFWRNSPFIFRLKKSESFQYFNSFSSTNEVPFPLVSMVAGRGSAIDTDGKSVFVTSIVNNAGIWRQAVSYCVADGEWDMMNGSIFPFVDLSEVTPDGICDVSYDYVSGDPVAMFMSGNSISIRMYDSSCSTWNNWRGYDVVCFDGYNDVPPAISSSSSSASLSSSSSSSCSSSSSYSSSSFSSSSSSYSSSSSSGPHNILMESEDASTQQIIAPELLDGGGTVAWLPKAGSWAKYKQVGTSVGAVTTTQILHQWNNPAASDYPDLIGIPYSDMFDNVLHSIGEIGDDKFNAKFEEYKSNVNCVQSVDDANDRLFQQGHNGRAAVKLLNPTNLGTGYKITRHFKETGPWSYVFQHRTLFIQVKVSGIAYTMEHYMYTYGNDGYRAATNNSGNATASGPSEGYLRIRSDGVDLHGEYSSDNIVWNTLHTWSGKGASAPTESFIAAQTNGGAFPTQGYCDWMTVEDGSGDPIYNDPTGQAI